jgi:hypothetical protein
LVTAATRRTPKSDTIRTVQVPTETTLWRRRGVASRPLDGGAVLVNMSSGACFELNRIGSEIWELLASATTETTICEALARKYEVDRAVLETDVRGLVVSLVNAGLVERVSTETAR